MRFYKLLFIIINIYFYQLALANNIFTKEYYIAYQNDFKIHLKEKKSNKVNGKTIILLSPLSIPSLEAFDVPDYSLMDILAIDGFDVWAVDFIGEGKSSFPDVMNRSPAPIGEWPLQASDALAQLNVVVNYISLITKQSKISLLGWSWGAVVASMYSIQNPQKIDKLILYGAMHSFLLPKFTQPFANKNNGFNSYLPAYQNIPWEIILGHWKMMSLDFVSKNALHVLKNTYAQIDKNAFIMDTIRRPMGPMRDLFEIWNNHPIYNIKKLTNPTLVIYGDHDLFADKELYNKLSNVKFKKNIEIKNATHWLIYENSRNQFYNAIIHFLNSYTDAKQ